jgi:hypothetical protein
MILRKRIIVSNKILQFILFLGGRGNCVCSGSDGVRGDNSQDEQPKPFVQQDPTSSTSLTPIIPQTLDELPNTTVLVGYFLGI